MEQNFKLLGEFDQFSMKKILFIEIFFMKKYQFDVLKVMTNGINHSALVIFGKLLRFEPYMKNKSSGYIFLSVY